MPVGMTNDCSRTRDGSRRVDGAGSTDAEIQFRPSIALVKRIADEAGISPIELPQLNETIDADALDDLLDVRSEESDHVWPTVVFTYANHRVRITADGHVSLSDTTGTEALTGGDWSHVSPVDVTSERDVATRVVSAVSDQSDRDPTRVQSAMQEVIDPDALVQLNRSRKNGVPRSGATVLFSMLGHDIAVDPDGTIAIGSALTRLKQTGGNVLMVGAVPDDLIDAASATLLGDPKRDRHHLFALLDRDETVVSTRLRSPDATSACVIDYAATSRSTANVSATDDAEPVVIDEPADFDELTMAVEEAIRDFTAEMTVSKPAELRFCLDSLQPILAEQDVNSAIAFLEPICDSIKAASGLAHYVLPIDRDTSTVRSLESLFDVTVELRVGEAGPEQRWHLHESNYTTDWVALCNPR